MMGKKLYNNSFFGKWGNHYCGSSLFNCRWGIKGENIALAVAKVTHFYPVPERTNGNKSEL